MTSSRDDVRRRVAGQTSQHIPDPDQDFDPWHDYLQLGRLVLESEEDTIINRSLGPWAAGRSSLSLDTEEKEQEFDLNSVESIAFSPSTSSGRSSLFSPGTAARRPHCASEETEEEFDHSSVESIAFSAGSSSSLFSDPTSRRRPRRFSTPTTSPSSASSSVSDTAGVVGAGGGGGARRPPRSFFGCRFCKQNGESAEIYLSHNLKSEDHRRIITTCPVLRRYTCPTCNATGDNAHTRRYCPLLQAQQGGGVGHGGHGEQMPTVLPETGGVLLPLWGLDWDTMQ